MAFEIAKAQLEKYGLADRIKLFDVSSATVELAAEALGCEGCRIAKTLSFMPKEGGGCILVVAAGDAKIDNPAFKAQFGIKAKMLSPDDAEARIGHAVGGVCPFGVKDGAEVYLDESLRRFDVIYPACGTSNSAVELTIEELERAAEPLGWVDVCKGWREE